MAYRIRTVNGGNADYTFLYDTPEETLSENPIRVSTPEGVKYASVDIATQKSHMKFVDGNGVIHRINAKGKDVYVLLEEKEFRPGSGVSFPIKGGANNLAPTYTFTLAEGQYAAKFPLCISAQSGSAYYITDKGHAPILGELIGSTPGISLAINIQYRILGITSSGSSVDMTIPIQDKYLRGGAGCGAYNSILVTKGSGWCSATGGDYKFCPDMSYVTGCGCTYDTDTGKYGCTWKGCTAETPRERGGYGAKADRFIVLPPLADPNIKRDLLTKFAYTGLAQINMLMYEIICNLPHPPSSAYGTQGKCNSIGGHCGSYYGGEVAYSNGIIWCDGAGCTSYTTDAKCSCDTSPAGISVNGPDGGIEGVTTEPVLDFTARIKIESIQ